MKYLVAITTLLVAIAAVVFLYDKYEDHKREEAREEMREESFRRQQDAANESREQLERMKKILDGTGDGKQDN